MSVRRARQLIPKSGGGMRELGIPTVLDRFIQQALLQVLQPKFDPSFSPHSYGFRPGRSAHQAAKAARRFVQEGRRVVVDVDLSKFFDRVNHDVLMGRLAKRIERGHAFARYADDCRVYVRSTRAGHRVMALLRRLYAKLRLRVNEEKSAVASDEWIRHRLRAIQLKQWKRGRTIFRELRARGLSVRLAGWIAFNGRRWWKNSAMGIHIALPNRTFDELGVPRLAA